MKKSISFIWVLTLLSGPVSASAFTAVKDTLPSIPEHNYIYVRTPLEANEEKNYDEIAVKYKKRIK